MDWVLVEQDKIYLKHTCVGPGKMVTHDSCKSRSGTEETCQ